MTNQRTPAGTTVEEIKDPSDLPRLSPSLSFFQPHIRHQVEEVLAIGGEAYVSQTQDETRAGRSVSGVFIFDSYERIGTAYTRSSEVFDYFCALKPDSYVNSEVEPPLPHETYDIYTIESANMPKEHVFSHEVGVAGESDLKDVLDFLQEEHPYMNPKWVRVAFDSGDRFFVVRLFGGWIAGLGWATLVNGVGRMNDVYVLPRYRKMGICGDILYARFLWLRSRGAKWSYSEVLRSNTTMARAALNEGMRVSGQIYGYTVP